MRTDLSPATLSLLQAGEFDAHWQVEVANGAGVMVDLSDRLAMIGGALPSPEVPIGTLDVEFLRAPNGENAAHLRQHAKSPGRRSTLAESSGAGAA